MDAIELLKNRMAVLLEQFQAKEMELNRLRQQKQDLELELSRMKVEKEQLENQLQERGSREKTPDLMRPEKQREVLDTVIADIDKILGSLHA